MGDDYLPWNMWQELTLDSYVPPTPERVAERYAGDYWWPQSPQDAARREFERWLKEYLCTKLGIGCADPQSL